jgi:hypothetical protein
MCSQGRSRSEEGTWGEVTSAIAKTAIGKLKEIFRVFLATELVLMFVTWGISRVAGSNQEDKELVHGREDGNSTIVAGVRTGIFLAQAHNGSCAPSCWYFACMQKAIQQCYEQSQDRSTSLFQLLSWEPIGAPLRSIVFPW